MRESENTHRGNRGEAAVAHAFMQLGWPSANAPGSDLGTDLFLMVRERRFDLGLLVGAQVKSGPSWFRERVRDDGGEVIGWWFRDDDREHVDYWLTHTLPHLIILHDLDTGTSYWRHITPDAVVPTGKGAKILVPLENTIDPGHFDALLAVAAAARPKSTWEGSVWADPSSILPTELMRHALLVPRLVAPHRNAGYSIEVGPEQVVALLVEGRLRDVDTFATRHSSIPSLEDAESASDWRWRLVHAIGVRVTTDSVDPLVTLVAEAPTPHARAAVTVAAAAGLLEQARPDDALPLLQAVLDEDASSPIDHAWLLVQRARAHRELGRLEQARADASEALRAKLSYGSDVTATAIAGAATEILWSISWWTTEDLQETITGVDTLAAWWRTQRIAAGSNAVIEREFRAWSQDRSIRFAEDVANNRLYTAALLASHLGDHGTWRTLSSLNAQQRFLRVSRTTDVDHVRGLVSELRNAGDDKALSRAVQHLLSEGPAEAVTAAAAEVDLHRWTHSNSQTNLTLFRRGGDVIDEEVAANAVNWLLATLVDSTEFVNTTTPIFSVEEGLVEALSGVIAAASVRQQIAVVERVAALSAITDELLARAWAKVVTALPADRWGGDRLKELVEKAECHHDKLRIALLRVAALINEQARRRLLDEAAALSMSALVALQNVDGLDDRIAAPVMASLERRVVADIEFARHGSERGRANVDPARTLAIFNLTHPHLSRWEKVYDLLEEPRIAGRYKIGVCKLLAAQADDLEPDVRKRLADIAAKMRTHSRTLIERTRHEPGASSVAAILAAAMTLDTNDISDRLLELMAGDSSQRSQAVSVALRLPDSQAASVLASLATDVDSRTRANAASGLALLCADNKGEHVANSALRLCMNDPGTLVPRSIVDQLSAMSSPSNQVIAAIRDLASHRSAHVRSGVAKLLAAHLRS